jgi:hypothetical protein
MAYGYVRDKEPLSINWAEISKNFNDRLAADEAERQGKREDIQKQYDELSQQLIDKPTGADTDLNSAIASFTTQASQASLDALNRLKRGEISEQEYYNRRANLKSSTNNLFLYANNFNGQLDENLKLIQSQDPDNQGSGRMAFQMALAQDMLNFKNTVAVIDPATDEVMLVKTDEEGNPTNEVVSVSQLGNLSSQKENSYNYKGKIARALENRGVSKYQTDDGTTVTTIQGVEINPKTATATIDKLAESFVGDESQILSILYQNGYQYTQDESLKGKDGYIYYDIKNGTYDYDENKAIEFVKEDINNSIPVQIDTSKVKTPQQKELERLQIKNLENQVALGKVKVNQARAEDVDISNLQPQLNEDIAQTIGNEVVNQFNANYESILGGPKKKSKNAIEASLDLLNRYGAGFATTIDVVGDEIKFTTPSYDASGKELKNPIEITYDVENIGNGNTLNALLESFILNYVDSRFIKNAYKKGKFSQTNLPKTESDQEVIQTDEFGVPLNT